MARYRYNKSSGKVEAKPEPVPNTLVLPELTAAQQVMYDIMKRKEEAIANSFYGQLNAQPRSPRNGRNRIPSPPTYRNPAGGAGARDDRATTLTPGGITYISAADWTNYIAATYPGADPVEPAPIPYAGVTVGEIIGYRAWWVVSVLRGDRPWVNGVPATSWHLRSLASDFNWPPGEIVQGDTGKVVKTYFDPFVGPKQIFGGVYAFRSPELDESTRQDIINIQLRWDNGCLAIGTCTLWGDVVEHEHGYRASHARLRSIDAVYGPMGCPSVADLRREYGLEEQA